MPDPVNLGYAFTLAPADAIEYFKGKGYAIGFGWQDVWQEANARAFTVAGIMKMDVLVDINTELQKALTEGTTLAKFIDDIEPTLQRKGWWGKGMIVDNATGEITGKRLNPYRLQTIFDTNVQSSYMAGRYKQFIENVDSRPNWQYVAVMDSRTRPAHRALNGRVFRYDDKAWGAFWPPNGYRCRCRVRALSNDDMTERGITVSDSTGYLRDVEVPAGNGKTATVTAYKAPGMQKGFAPDPGFNFNPGQTVWQPDLTRYPPRLAQQFQQQKPTVP
jgi:SPP1 gp7 family putative phage head morphogenesis protein